MLVLRGTEAITIELGGTVAAAVLEPLLATSGVAPESDAEGVRVSLLLFRMQGLHLRGLPWPAFHYGEALWRIGVRHREVPAWLAVACDLDSSFIRFSGALLIRYPVRRAQLAFSALEQAFSAKVEGAGGALVVRARAGETEPRPASARPLLVSSHGRLFRIPWREQPAPYRRVAELESLTGDLAATTFGGPVRWDPTGLCHRGRIHFCGIARRA